MPESDRAKQAIAYIKQVDHLISRIRKDTEDVIELARILKERVEGHEDEPENKD